MNTKPAIYSISRVWLALTVLAGMLHQSTLPAIAASQFDIHGPAGSVRFGTSVAVLPNGNIVVTDPHYNGGIGVDAGAAYLYNGATGALISMLTGLTAGDQVGSGGVTLLSNGNYLVNSPYWDNGVVTDAGAVTWGSKTSGVSGTVSALNSLVGSTANEIVGFDVHKLSNGNYVLCTPWWDNGAIANVGAITWGNGTSGTTGVISTTNSLVGSTVNDWVGGQGFFELSNGNYVVRSLKWDNGSMADAGAVTWGSGTGIISGTVSVLNSLVGSMANDQVSSSGVTPLSNGNYVVESRYWDKGAISNAGAVTWGSGTSGVSGVVSALNSLVGTHTDDGVGIGVVELSNGNFVVRNRFWDNNASTDAGAVTWGDGTSGVSGVVSATNSLVGTHTGDAGWHWR